LTKCCLASLGKFIYEDTSSRSGCRHTSAIIFASDDAPVYLVCRSKSDLFEAGSVCLFLVRYVQTVGG
jgi:hypothetical protein